MNMDEQQLPPGWELVTINDLCAINPKHAAGIPDETPVSFVPMAAVSDVHGRIETPEVRPYGEIKRGFTHFADGDVIFAKITPCMENGKAASVRGLVNGLGCGTTEFFVFRSKGALSQDYLFHFIRQESYRKLARAQMQSGVGQARVPREFIEDTEIPLPPLPEQRRIVAKIEALQERSGRAAKALEEVGPLLEQFRQSILAAAFSGRLTADWREKNPNVEPAQELLARIRTERRQRWEQTELAKYEAKGKQPPRDWKDKYEEPEPVDETDLPELPDGWCWAHLEEVATDEKNSIKAGPFGSSLKKEFYVESGYKIYGQEQVIKGDPYYGDYYIDEDRFNSLSSCSVKPGDLLISLVGTIGRTLVLPLDAAPGIINPRLIKITLQQDCMKSPFLQYYFRAPQVLDIFSRISHGGTMEILNMGTLKTLAYPLPPLEEQDEVVRRIEQAMDRVAEIESIVSVSTSDLTQLNQSILAKAFRGELVPQDPNDESASELLARIRREREQEVSGGRVQGSGRKKKAGGKGNASESARPAKRSNRSSKAASAATPDVSADTSPEPARPQRRRRRSSSNNVDASLVIRVLAEGGAVNIHADTSGPTVQFYTKSSGGSLLAEIEGYDDLDDTESQPRESQRVANLRDLMEPELALLYPKDINPTYLPQLRTWHTWATTQIPDHFDKDRILEANQRWSEAFESSAPSTSARQTRKAHNGRLFDA